MGYRVSCVGDIRVWFVVNTTGLPGRWVEHRRRLEYTRISAFNV